MNENETNAKVADALREASCVLKTAAEDRNTPMLLPENILFIISEVLRVAADDIQK